MKNISFDVCSVYFLIFFLDTSSVALLSLTHTHTITWSGNDAKFTWWWWWWLKAVCMICFRPVGLNNATCLRCVCVCCIWWEKKCEMKIANFFLSLHNGVCVCVWMWWVAWMPGWLCITLKMKNKKKTRKSKDVQINTKMKVKVKKYTHNVWCLIFFAHFTTTIRLPHFHTAANTQTHWFQKKKENKFQRISDLYRLTPSYYSCVSIAWSSCFLFFIVYIKVFFLIHEENTHTHTNNFTVFEPKKAAFDTKMWWPNRGNIMYTHTNSE